ncbi:hypothetical protein QCA50_013048 [Cerrena zonata]|uniref:Uncharacterized protein n=1 Tax=Cerrena zonata TaxID=2478898 RepID=A0AAW0FWG7_9APHY
MLLLQKDLQADGKTGLLQEKQLNFLVTLQQQAGIDEFNIVRYAEQLCTPLTHISTILRLCAYPKYLGLHLRTQIISNPLPSADPQTIPEPRYDEEVVFDFIRSASPEKLIHPHSPAVYAEGTSSLVREVLQNLHEGKQRPISGPHSTCLLIQHHLNNPHSPSYLYIAIAKPSCFRCAIYLDAYNSCARRFGHKLLSTKARDSQVYPCLLPPSNNPEADAFIVDHMKNVINHTIDRLLLRRTYELTHPPWLARKCTSNIRIARVTKFIGSSIKSSGRLS